MKLLKAISIKQPWTNMIASGEKTIETRHWPTKYRGPLLIVSSKKPDIPPAGSAVALATLIDCRPMTRADEIAARCSLYPGAYSWVLQEVRRLKPFPVRGQLGIYDVSIADDDLVFE
jgi:ASCH domain-containing protein